MLLLAITVSKSKFSYTMHCMEAQCKMQLRTSQ